MAEQKLKRKEEYVNVEVRKDILDILREQGNEDINEVLKYMAIVVPKEKDLIETFRVAMEEADIILKKHRKLDEINKKWVQWRIERMKKAYKNYVKFLKRYYGF
jgi:hypothetical protein